MRGTPSRNVSLLLVTVLMAAVGCTHRQATQAAPSSAAPTTATPTPTKPKPRPRPRPPRVIRNPLTGLLGVPTGPVIAVKIDNTPAGRPQVGLESADVVYVEQVEGGQTRLVALFASRQPHRVEPVRSVRNADPELLANYGRLALAFSGGAGAPLATLHRSGLIDASPAAKGFAYYRDGGRPAPYNLVVDLPRLASGLPRVTERVRDVGFRWNGAPDRRIAAAKQVTRLNTVIGVTPLSFRWDWGGRRWVLIEPDGSIRQSASGVPLGAPNVIFQFCHVTVDRSDVDVVGNPAQYTHSIGQGHAVLFRNGRGVVARWVRPTRHSPTRYVDYGGHDLTLQPGGVWVLLVPAGSPWTAR